MTVTTTRQHGTAGGQRTVGALLILGIGFVLVTLLTRTWGLHVDEIIYFDQAIRDPLGDARVSGKPYVFYAFNFALYHLLRRPVGPFHPLILPVFYAVATVVALWRHAKSASSTSATPRWTFALLLFSPFVLFNATQLMMETALLPLMSCALALLLSARREESRPVAALWLALIATVSTLMKGTAIPALAALTFAFAPTLRLRVWPLAAGVVVGAVGNPLLLRAVQAPESFPYGSVSQLLASIGALQPWQRLPTDLGVWVFLVGLASAGAVWSWWERRDAPSRTLLALCALSAVGSTLVQLATHPTLPFPRYAYPVIWVGLAGSAIACARSHTKWLAPVVLASQLPWITALWPGVFPTVQYWPAQITTESYRSGGTILSGSPVHGWILTSARARARLCVYLPRSNAAGALQAEPWLRAVTEQVTFHDERQLSEFQTCQGARLIFDRRFSVNACELDPCPPSRYRIRSCLREDIRFYSPQFGEVNSRVCLP
jgi:hypothetical protein